MTKRESVTKSLMKKKSFGTRKKPNSEKKLTRTKSNGARIDDFRSGRHSLAKNYVSHVSGNGWIWCFLWDKNELRTFLERRKQNCFLYKKMKPSLMSGLNFFSEFRKSFSRNTYLGVAVLESPCTLFTPLLKALHQYLSFCALHCFALCLF